MRRIWTAPTLVRRASRCCGLARKRRPSGAFSPRSGDALSSLYRSSSDVLGEGDVRHLRDQADRIARYVEDLDLVRERAVMLQEEIQNRLAEQQNARTYLLSVVAAIFLPLSFLTGIFGMNVAGLPGTEAPDAFLLLSLGMTAIALGLALWLRWKRWL